MALKVGELFASFNVDTSGVSSAVNSVEKQLSSVGKNMMIGGAAMTAAVTVPITKAASDIYKAGSDFDAQMSKVFAIAGDEVTNSLEAMEALRAAAIEMGSTTSFTASEAGEALQYMAMAGWKTDDMLAGLAPIMNLAAASGEDLGTVSDIVTDALTAFGLSAEDTAHFADVLAAASSNSNTNVAIMGESFKYIAPLAGSLGYSVDDVAVALGLMANAGIKGSMAGTSLRQVISNLISPTDAQAAAMETLGISLLDSNGKVKSLSELMGDMRKAAAESGFDMQALSEKVAELDGQLEAGTITEAEYDAQIQALTNGNGDFLKAISDLAGARGLSGLLAIMNATEEDFEKLTQAVNKSSGAANKMSKLMLDNAKGDITLFNSALEGLEITLWELAEGGFRKVVQSATKYVDSFRNADQETQKGTLLMAALAAATGPVMAGMGSIITLLPKLAKTFTFVSGPTAMLALGLVALGAAAIDSNNSIGKTFVKGMTKAGNKVRQFGKDVKKRLPDLTKNMGEFLGSISAGIAEGLPGIMDGLGDILSTGITALAKNMKNVGAVAQTLVRTLAQGIKQNMPQIASAAIDLLVELASTMISNIPVVLEGISTVITALIKEVNAADWGDIGSKLGESIKTSMSQIGTWFKQLAMGDQYKDDATWTEVGSALVTNILEGAKKAFGNLRDFVGSLMLGDEYDPDEDWSTFGGKIVDKIFEGVDGAINGGAEFVSGILDGLAGVFSSDNIKGAADALSGIVSRIITAAADEIPKLADKAGTILTKLGELIFGKDGKEGLAATALAGASTLATAIINAIVNSIPGIETAATQLLVAFADILSPSNIEKFGDSAKTLASNLLTAIGNAIKTLGSSAVSILTAICDALFTPDEGGDSMVSAGITALGEIVEQILTSIATDIIPGLATAAGDILTAIGNALFSTNAEGDSVISSGLKSLTSIMETILTKLATEVIPSLGASVVNILTAIGNALFSTNGEGKTAISAGLEALTGIMVTIITKLTTEIIPALANEASGILTAIGNALFKPGKDGQSAVSAGVTALTGIVETIFNTISTQIVPSMGTAVGGILTAIAGLFTKENMSKLGDSLGNLAGSIIKGIADTIGAIVDALSGITDGKELGNVAEGFETLIQSLAENILNALAYAIPKLVDAGGKLLGSLAQLFSTDNMAAWVDGAAELASGILDSLKTAFESDGTEETALGESFSGIVQGLITGLIHAIEHLPELLEGVLSVGAQIANSIMRSISAALQDLEASGIANTFGTALADLVKGLLKSITNFNSDSNVIEFVRNLGKGITAALGTIGSTLGSFVGELLKYLFSKEGLTDIFNAGVSLINLLWEGMKSAVGGVFNFFGNFVEGILISLGVIDVEKAAAYNAAMTAERTLLDYAREGFEDYAAYYFDDDEGIESDGFQQMALLALFGANGTGTLSSVADMSKSYVQEFKRVAEDAINEGYDDDRWQFDSWADQMWEDLDRAVTVDGTDRSISTDRVKQIMAPYFKTLGIGIDALGDDVYDMIAQYVAWGGIDNKNALWEMILTSVLGDSFIAGQQQAADASDEAVTKAMEGMGTAAAEAAEEAYDTIADALDGSGNNFAVNGYTAELANGEKPASEAALKVTDAVVHQFLLTMSAENGATIAKAFLGGIIAVLEDGSLIAVFNTLATDSYNTINAILSSGAGSGIGQNFGQGLADGISSMTSIVVTAAHNLGISAANALSSAIQEGSPSKLTAQSGENFGLGFINHILAGVEDASDAAALMGASAAESLDATVDDIRGTAADEMSLPTRRRTSEAETQAVESEKNAQQIAAAIANALNGCTVAMNGEKVGELVMPTVSEGIAAESESKRWGTV